MPLSTDTFRAPAYYASAFINGDYSSLDDAEEKAVEYILDWIKQVYGEEATIVDCEDAGFARNMSPLIPAPEDDMGDMADIWLGGDTCMYTVLYHENGA